MYLAPLTYNYFFQKAFSNPDIMKNFLEDLLEATITELVVLPQKHKLTDKSYYVIFDYRCKIDSKDTVVEMQQGYKKDVVKRFYLYQGVGVALQLENLPVKEVKGSGRKIRDYSGVVPVLTIVWMADDTFKTKENLLNYRLFPTALASR